MATQTDCDEVTAREKNLGGLGLYDFLATVVARGADVVAQMNLAGGWLNGRGRISQKIVRTVHAALRRRLLILLDSHG